MNINLAAVNFKTILPSRGRYTCTCGIYFRPKNWFTLVHWEFGHCTPEFPLKNTILGKMVVACGKGERGECVGEKRFTVLSFYLRLRVML